jgi:anti-sigma factor RsiW
MAASTHIADRLNAWLSGSLPASEGADIRAHLASCTACEEERRLLEESRAVLRPVDPAEPRPWFAAKVAARAAELRPRPVGAPWWRWAFGGGLAAAALAAAALFVAPALRGPQGPRDDMVLAQRLDLFEDLGIVQNEEALEDFEVVEVLHTLKPQGRP